MYVRIVLRMVLIQSHFITGPCHSYCSSQLVFMPGNWSLYMAQDITGDGTFRCWLQPTRACIMPSQYICFSSCSFTPVSHFHSGSPNIHFCLTYCTTCVHFGVVVCGSVLCLCTLLVVRAMERFAEQ